MSLGRFVWFELMTRDVAAARAFYSELLGWRIDLAGTVDGDAYPTIKVGEQPIGGLVRLEGAGETPSHWIGYVAVDDVDAASRRATALGGSVALEPADIPGGGGRYAHLRDPHGGRFGVFEGPQVGVSPPPNQTPHGHFGFPELWTPDPEASLRFYGELFGWSRSKEIPLGAPGTYLVTAQGGTPDAGGLMPWPSGFHGRIAWVQYAHVARVDPVVERLRALGGTVFVPPEDLPGMGRFAIVEDPTGAVFAVYNLLAG
jgi:predicted enzyme related to lactoylglutathione lyase